MLLVSGSLTGISSSELASQSCVAPQISTMASNGVAPQMSNNVTVMQRQRHGHRFCDEIDLNNPLCQNPPHSMNYQYQGKGQLLIVKKTVLIHKHYILQCCFVLDSIALSFYFVCVTLCLRRDSNQGPVEQTQTGFTDTSGHSATPGTWFIAGVC